MHHGHVIWHTPKLLHVLQEDFSDSFRRAPSARTEHVMRSTTRDASLEDERCRNTRETCNGEPLPNRDERDHIDRCEHGDEEADERRRADLAARVSTYLHDEEPCEERADETCGERALKLADAIESHAPLWQHEDLWRHEDLWQHEDERGNDTGDKRDCDWCARMVPQRCVQRGSRRVWSPPTRAADDRIWHDRLTTRWTRAARPIHVRDFAPREK